MTFFETVAQLESHILDMLGRAVIDLDEVDRSNRDDLGGRIGGAALLEDGSVIPIGWWLWADREIEDPMLVDNDGWSMAPYGASDLMGAEFTVISDELERAFADLADEDGGVEFSRGRADSIEMLIAGLTADYMPGEQKAIALWEEDLREEVVAAVKYAGLETLLGMLSTNA